MLIDRSHKRWIGSIVVVGVLATGFYVWLDRTVAGGIAGGSFWGLIYGLVGSALMVFAGLLAAHRKLLRSAFIPRRSWWLKGHLWLGLLSAVIIFCHSRFGFGGPFEQVLWTVFGLVLLSGIVLVLVQQFLPMHMTQSIPGEAPYEQIPYLCRNLRRQSDALVASLCGGYLDQETPPPATAGHPQLDVQTRKLLWAFYDQQVRPFLLDDYKRASPFALPGRNRDVFAPLRAAPGLAPVRDELGQLEDTCEQRRQLGEQERLHHWMHGLLLVHVPLSLALLVLGITHAVMALYY